MIHLMVVYCLSLNPYVCRTLELVPADGHLIASQIECMMGGMMGSAEFRFEGALWFVKGAYCRQEIDTELREALDAARRQLDR